MRKDDLSDLGVFLAVAEAEGFTRAAGRLGTSQSALSHSIRRLETRLGVRLLTRTTRSVAPTEAGDRLLEVLKPALAGIEDRLSVLTETPDSLVGKVRLTSGEVAANAYVWPRLAPLLKAHPGIRLDLVLDNGLVDIVADRFDAGIRLGEQIDRDMIAVPISPDMRMAVFASPDYLKLNPPPVTPHDLTGHACINFHLPTLGGNYSWEFEKDGRELRVRVDGALTFNDMRFAVDAAVAGFGIACSMETRILPYLESGQLVRLLEDWCPAFPGYHLYYPSRRQPTAAFTAVLNALRQPRAA